MYRLADKRELALPALYDAALIAKPEDAAYIQNLTCKIMAEQMVAAGTLNKEDFERYLLENCNLPVDYSNSRRPRNWNLDSKHNKPLTDEDMKPVFGVIPNPASETIKINHTSEEPVNVVIMDVYGHKKMQLVIAKGQQSAEFNVSDLASGVYFVSLNLTNGQVSSKKLVIAH